MASFPRVVLVGSVSIFAIIGILAVVKKKDSKEIEEGKVTLAEVEESEEMAPQTEQIKPLHYHTPIEKTAHPTKLVVNQDDGEHVDRIHQFFSVGPSKFPIVETITYTSRVPWLKGRPAWIADYASHFKTSRHFIARSLNGKPDYITQKVAPGDQFNVLKNEMNFNFYLLVDLSRCKMWFYYIDLDTDERVLIKTYKVGVGRLEDYSESGTLTPLGRFALGEKVALYKPGVMGFFQGQQSEMIQTFGTRWIPFDPAEENNNRAYKGYGMHGAPWIADEETGELKEDRACVGTYDSDGCIRLYREDMEELFSIIIARPTVVEVVRDKALVELPGTEKQEEFFQLTSERENAKSRETDH